MSSADGMPEPMARRVGYRLKQAQILLRQRMDAVLRPFGLTTPQYAALSAIELAPGISNAALARAAFVTPQTMQGIVANLEREGLIERSADPAHGRRLRTMLTPSGRTAMSRAHEAVSHVEAAMIGRLSDDEATMLAALLGRCAESLGETEGFC
jgi:DNA-binding MarR family transcriptional regulator